MEDDRYLYALLGATVGCVAGVGLLTGVLFYWFNPGGADCSFNVAVIVSSLVLAILLPAASLHPKVAPLTLHAIYSQLFMQCTPVVWLCNQLKLYQSDEPLQPAHETSRQPSSIPVRGLC